MKFKFFTASLLIMALSATAQSHLGIADKVRIRQLKMEQRKPELFQFTRQTPKTVNEMLGVPQTHALAIVKLADGATEADLKAQGVNVLRTSFGFAFISVPLDDAERVASLKSITNFQMERPMEQKLKYAREDTGVDKIHQGIGLSQAYTGKGIVCGIVDNGFDVNHLNFKDENGNSRLKYFEVVDTKQGQTIEEMIKRTVYNTPEKINEYKTDAASTYHGTHTAGIMAGGYRGNAKVATLTNNGQTGSKVEEGIANPYYGVAYDADICAASCTALTDIQIAIAVEDLLYYAEYVNKPIVVNLSLGSNQGSHDGKATVCQYFDVLAKELNAKIILATGNEGDEKIAATKTFTADDKEFKTFVVGDSVKMSEGTIYVRSGQLQIYSDTDKPFKSFKVVVYNTERKRNSKTFELNLTEDTKGNGLYFCSENYKEYDNDVVDATFDRYFSGYLGLYWDTDQVVGRSLCTLDFEVIDNPETNPEGKYQVAVFVEGEEGQRLDAFMAGYYYGMSDLKMEGWDDGSSNGSISDVACGKSTLSVGSYNSTTAWAQLDGWAYKQPGSGIEFGEVTPFSSYGTLIDGRNLPDVLAPGAYLVSSMNRYYLEDQHILGDDILSAVATVDGIDYPYAWAAGTSMACPMVTGIVALWLEADPTLTIEDIRDIIKKTSRMDDAMKKADPAKVGSGKIDAYEGLKEVLRRKGESGVGSVVADDSRLVVSQCGERAVNVFLAGANDINAEVFTMTGVKVTSQHGDGDELTIDLAGKNNGAYLIRVNGKHSKCILVK